MGDLKIGLGIVACLFLFPSVYLWTRGYKKTLLAFIGAILSMFVFVAGILVNNTPLMIGSVVFVPLCFGVYFISKHKERILDFLRNTRKEYSIEKTIGWCIPIAIALSIDTKYVLYIFIAYIMSCFFMNDFKGTFFYRVRFLLGCAFLFCVFVVIMYILGHLSSRFY